MDIKEMDIRNQIKALAALNAMTITSLTKEMSKRTGKNYTYSSITNKLKRESLSLKEAYLIADILGYDLEFIRKS